MVKFPAQAKDARKKRSRKKPDLRHKVSFALADFDCGGSTGLEQSKTPYTSASLKFDTIQALIRQFEQRRLQEKVEC
jgi:hypothetical protein